MELSAWLGSPNAFKSFDSKTRPKNPQERKGDRWCSTQSQQAMSCIDNSRFCFQWMPKRHALQSTLRLKGIYHDVVAGGRFMVCTGI